jgi:hypothetical protein
MAIESERINAAFGGERALVARTSVFAGRHASYLKKISAPPRAS